MEQREIEVIRKIKSSIGKTVYYRDDYMGYRNILKLNIILFNFLEV